jgi:hypothetical protein
MAVRILNQSTNILNGYTRIVQPEWIPLDSRVEVYAGDDQSPGTTGTNLYYDINGGSTQTLVSNINGSSCTIRGQITGLRPGDVVTFFSGTGGTPAWKIYSVTGTAVCPTMQGSSNTTTFTVPSTAGQENLNTSFLCAITISSGIGP